jgi:hypothetical protein
MKSLRRDVFETHNPADSALDVTAPACELLAFFLADKPVHALVAKYKFDAIAQEYASYRQERIVKLLIEIATSYRLVSWRLTNEERAKERRFDVGVLTIRDSDSDLSLSMHEACNKIIHADEFAFETRKVRGQGVAYITDDTVLAAGKRGQQDWSITLWIPEFCEAALDMPFPGGNPFKGLTNRSSQPPPGDEIPF